MGSSVVRMYFDKNVLKGVFTIKAIRNQLNKEDRIESKTATNLGSH